MVKLAHFPKPGELKRLRDVESEVELFPDFSTTLASGIDDTIRNLRVIREHSHASEEEERARNRAIEQLREEISKLRKELDTVIGSVRTKASKGTLKTFGDALTGKIDRRVDNLFKFVGVLGVAIGALIAYKGH